MNNKGVAWLSLIIKIAAVVVAAIVLAVIYFFGFGGFGIGGGKGDGEGSGTETVSSSDALEQTEINTEITEPETEELKYIEITVSGNEYIYNNKKYALDDLVSELEGIELDAPVKITDDKSSMKAYYSLKDALAEKDIHFIEAN